MRFKEYITELFDTKVKVTTFSDTSSVYIIEFEAEGIIYHAAFYKKGRLGGYEILFAPERSLRSDKPLDKVIGNLNTKEVLAVFSGVRQAVEKFIKEKDPKVFYFSPEHSKLKPIYDKFVKELKRRLKNYKYEFRSGYEHVFFKD
jgi:hypothetical protein